MNVSLRCAALILVGSCLACSNERSAPAAPSSSAATGVPTRSPTPVATATPPRPTPTPAPTCSYSITPASFEPERVTCPFAESVLTMRLVFDVNVASGVPLTINRVSTFGSRCQVSGGTCTWPDGPTVVSPSFAPAGTTTQIEATQRFTCSSGGSARFGVLITIDKLFVNTSCGASREITVSNNFVVSSN